MRRFKKVSSRSYSAKHALMWSLIPLNSTYSQKHNQGRGLDTIVTLTKSLKGEITLYSSGIKYTLGFDPTSGSFVDVFTTNPIDSFKGTLILLTLPLSELPDNTESSFDF
jgi:hypothetical protein